MSIIPYKPKLEKGIEQDLVKSKHIGLHVIETIKKTPITLCLCSQENIYTFPVSEDNHTSFLRSLMTDNRLIFFTIDGTFDADYLRTYMSIELVGAIDLLAFDISNDIRDYIRDNPREIVTFGRVVNKVKPRRHEYHELVEIMWGINSSDLKYCQADLEAVETIPYSVGAKNVILKKCALIRVTGIKMTEDFEALVRIPSQAIYSLASRASDDTREDYNRRADRRFLTLSNVLAACPLEGSCIKRSNH